VEGHIKLHFHAKFVDPNLAIERQTCFLVNDAFYAYRIQEHVATYIRRVTKGFIGACSSQFLARAACPLQI